MKPTQKSTSNEKSRRDDDQGNTNPLTDHANRFFTISQSQVKNPPCL